MQISLLLTLSLLFVSCGKHSDQTSRQMTGEARKSEKKPIQIKVEPETCSSLKIPINPEKGLFLFENSTLGFYKKEIPWEKFFSRKVISEILYYGKYTTVIKGDLILNIENESPKKFNFCPNDSTSNPNTVESIALNTSYYITKTHDYFYQHTKINLPPIALHLVPEISEASSSASEKRYLTDNAFYSVNSTKITFLPHGNEAKNNGLFMNFWEIPFIPAHEYAHHIFKQLFPYHTEMNSIYARDCFEDIKTSHFRENAETRKTSLITVLNAVNEAFADLIAFYTLSKEERNLDQIPCIEISREVTSPFFIDGAAKVFSEDVLYTFFNSKKSQFFKSCERTNFQRIHDFGAVFAHNLDKILSLYTSENHQKIRILTTWIAFLRHEHEMHHKLSPRKYFDTIFSLFLRLTMTHFGKTFDQNTCNELEQIYPNFTFKFGECSSF